MASSFVVDLEDLLALSCSLAGKGEFLPVKQGLDLSSFMLLKGNSVIFYQSLVSQICIFGFIVHTLSCTLRLFQLGQLNKQLKVHFAFSSLGFLSTAIG